MTKLKIKKPILIGIILTATALIIAVLLLLLLPKKQPDPRALLAKADTLSEQNLCLTAIVKADPADEASWRQLLLNYQLLGADPLTIEATRLASGFEIELAKDAERQEEPKGKNIGMGGILQGGKRITHYKNANSLATDGETVYLAREDGIYAHYYGIEVKITPAKAERMIAAENGLYFLNSIEKLVQYIARDGHRIENLSAISAVDFAFFEDALWIAGTDGKLYKNGAALENEHTVLELCAAKDRLYAACKEGLAEIAEGKTSLLIPSSLSSLTADESGRLYYINQAGFPAQYAPTLKESTILETKTAIAIGCDEGKVYYLNKKHKIKGC